MRVFARTRNINDPMCGRVPFNYNIATAMYGFHDMGFEIVLYEDVNEVYEEYRRGDIVLDGIQQVEYCLSKYGIKPVNEDYPEVFRKYMGRDIWYDTINNINNHPELWGVFVKHSKEEKKFTGRVINSLEDLVGCGVQGEDTEVVCTETVEFVSEFRGFYYYGELIDLRPYKGDWRLMKNLDTELIEKAVEEYSNSETELAACSLDWGITKEGRTLFVEQNAFYACGCYGLQQNLYAKMLSAYTSQISGVADPCQFIPVQYR